MSYRFSVNRISVLSIALLITGCIFGCSCKKEEACTTCPPPPPVAGPLPPNSYISDVEFIDELTGWIVIGYVNSGVYKTVDGGKTWTQQYKDGNPDLSMHTLFVADRQNIWAVGDSARIVLSEDGGTTWRRQVTNSQTSLYDIQFVNVREGWSVGRGWGSLSGCDRGNNEILHTTDSGKVWQSVYRGTEGYLSGVHFHNNKGWAVGGGLLDAGCDPLILHTEDSGLTWARQNITSPGTLVKIRFNANHTLGFAIGLNQTLRTQDYGNSWEDVRTNDVESTLDCAVHGDSVVWLIGRKPLPGRSISNRGALFKSTNSGTTWSISWEADTTKQPWRQYLYAIDFLNDSTGWAVGSPSLVLRYSRQGWKEVIP